MNTIESSAEPESEDSPELAGLAPELPDSVVPPVASLVPPDVSTPVVSLHPPVLQKQVAAAQPVGDILVEPEAVPQVPPAKRRRSFHPHLRPVHIPVRVHTFDSMRYRDYRLLWVITVFASSGFWLQQVVVGWLTYEITQSAFWTSIAMGLDALPVLLAGPIGGLLVDSWDRRKLLALIFAYQAAVTTAFSIIVLLGMATTWHIFGFILLMGLSWVITDPARIALIPSIVPKHHLVNAFALNSMAFSVTRLAAPAIGGVLIAFVGVGPALLVEAAVQVAALSTVLALKVVVSYRTRFRFSSVFSRLWEGAQYVKGEPVLMGMMFFTAMPSALVMPFVHGLMPVYAAEIFDVGSEGLGLLLASIGVGATLGTVLVASLGDIRHKGRLVIVSQALTAISMAIFSLNPSLMLAYLNLVLLSMSVMMFFATSGAIVHSIVSDELRGRVTGLFMMTWGVTLPGSFLAGMLAQDLGAPLATLIGSVLVVLALGVSILRFRQVWSLS